MHHWSKFIDMLDRAVMISGPGEANARILASTNLQRGDGAEFASPGQMLQLKELDRDSVRAPPVDVSRRGVIVAPNAYATRVSPLHC